jgi:SAM-dependent methyltransferase
MIPFNHHASALPANLNNKNRLRLYRKFIGKHKLFGNSLDIGEPGYISTEIQVRHNTFTTDFNREVKAQRNDYEVITCFEVINHLFNPLQFLEQIRSLMSPNGVLYLSHPKLWLIAAHHCRFDFCDYEPSRFIQMCEYAGFKVVRHETRNPWPLRFMLTGFRPIARTLFNRIEIYEMRKA